MSQISLLAIPNVVGMRVLWYIQIVVYVLIFGTCLFVICYYLIRYIQRKKTSHAADLVWQQAHVLEQQLLIKHIHQATGKWKLVLFIEYLEKFITTHKVTYATIPELLLAHGFTPAEVQICEQVLYQNAPLPDDLISKIDLFLR